MTPAAITPTFAPLALGSIQPQGWMLEQLRRDLDGIAGHLDQLCPEAGSNVFATRSLGGPGRRHWWNGETEGNWMLGLLGTAYLAGDHASRQKSADYVRHILAAQGADGYLGVYDDQARAAGVPRTGDLWTQSRIYTLLLDYHELTGYAAALQALERAAERTIEDCSDLPAGLTYFERLTGQGNAGLAHGLMIVEPMLRLFEKTGEARYLAFAEYCYESFSRAHFVPTVSVADAVTPGMDIIDDCQIDHLLDAERPLLGHGAHTCEHLRIPLLLYRFTGKGRYRAAYRGGYGKIVRYLGVSGAPKSDEYLGSPDTDGVPLPETGYEYCAVTELAHSLIAALLFEGEMHHADAVEHLLLNAAQGARRHDGRGIAYFAADNQYAASSRFGPQWDYSPTHDDLAVCCAPNAVRLLPHFVARMLVRGPGDGLTIVFYGPSTAEATVRGVRILLEQRTAFPFEEEVEIGVHPDIPVAFTLSLRVPGWCAAPVVRVNGEDAGQRRADVVILERTWTAGDRVHLRFPMSVSVIRAADNSAALQYGPLVFSLPISAQATPTRAYDLPGFHDTNYEPTPDSWWHYTLQIDERDPGRTAAVERVAVPETAFPWEDPPVRLRAAALVSGPTPTPANSHAASLCLVPLGSTRLRRTCFPSVDRSARPLIEPL